MKESEDTRVVYADIIDHPHHQSETRTHMSLYDRAAQFSAFDALAGYSDMITEEARLTEGEISLDDNAVELLNRKLALIADAIESGQHPTVTFTVFVPDQVKAGGKYEEITEKVKRIDATEQKVILERKREKSGINDSLNLSRIISIHGHSVDIEGRDS